MKLHELSKRVLDNRINNCFVLVLSFILLFNIVSTLTAAEANRLIVNADLGQQKINRHIYGHFAEHLGYCIYGGIWVGEDSPIPNTRGIRNDIVQALRKIEIPNLRWPGGCFADTYHWMDGIGPREKRPTIVNVHWGGVTENNHFGTHEFLDLCEQLDTEPLICGNVGSGSVQELAQWVEYVNFDGISPMADLRRTNGREEPWKVKFWGIGNENWGCGGQMSPEHYAEEYLQFANFVRDYGGTEVYKIACGPNSDNYEWTDVLMRDAAGGWRRPRINGIDLHYYTRPVGYSMRTQGQYRIINTSGPELSRSATQFGEPEWFAIMNQALRIDELIQNHSAIMDKYDPQKNVHLCVGEWGTWYEVESGTNPGFLYQQNSLRDALVAGLSLNIFNKHSDRVQMANIAQTINVLQAMVLTKDEKMILTPTYHVFEMYKVHQDAMLLPTDLKCVDFINEPPAEERRPGRFMADPQKTPALNVSASKDENGKVHISLCNLDPKKDIELVCELRGIKARKVTGRILTAPTINAHNTFEKPDVVKPDVFTNFKLKDNNLTSTLPSKSVVVLEVE
ncbi:alpha-N-arabinofuranosidase [candidate division KSB1 bacterium]|nr:alpha-N-arabinofuranosidase [candidate division KSB1 bacterium]